jgi:hypothetical protein
MLDTWAVIPSGGRREQLKFLVARLLGDDVNVVIIDTGYAPQLREHEWNCFVIRDVGPKNISRWWNTGIDFIASLHTADSRYAVAVLNDDVIVGGLQLRHLAQRMFDENAAVTYPNVHGHDRDVLLDTAAPVDLRLRMLGCCFVLNPRSGLRADESLVWWYGDDDIDWRARGRGGSLLVHDVIIQHVSPNGWQSTNPELIAQTALDRTTFLKKWGTTPW